MAQVVLTGGSGELGRACLSELLEHGYSVTNVDLVRPPDDDPAQRKWNLWSYIDARDAAQAVRKALEAPWKGAEVFIIASPDTVMSRPITELMAEFYPAVPWRHEVGPLGSTQQAKTP